MSAIKHFTYHKGPLGWAVSRDGKPIGAIHKRPVGGGWVYVVSVTGMRPNGQLPRGACTFPTLRKAQNAVEALS